MSYNVDSPNLNLKKARNRMTFYLPIILMIVGTTTEKSESTHVNPLFSLAINYLTATLSLSPIRGWLKNEKAGRKSQVAAT
jgi:hypothetical protein